MRKTPKVFVAGALRRSESGRSYDVRSAGGEWLANAPRASRKDVRDAVAAARKAGSLWAGATALNRGQVLYRIAEMLEARRDEFAREVVLAEGDDAAVQVDEAIDVLVWYAGWTDKLAQIAGNANPVAGPYFNLTVPEPIGVAGIVVASRPSLNGLVSRLAPALCAANTVVVLASEAHPLPALSFSECLATADVPPGVVNILSGHAHELVPVLAGHLDVDAIDVTGVEQDALEEVERLAAGNVKRVIRAAGGASPYEALAFTEYKTVWHPKGP